MKSEFLRKSLYSTIFNFHCMYFDFGVFSENFSIPLFFQSCSMHKKAHKQAREVFFASGSILYFYSCEDLQNADMLSINP